MEVGLPNIAGLWDPGPGSGTLGQAQPPSMRPSARSPRWTPRLPPCAGKHPASGRHTTSGGAGQGLGSSEPLPCPLPVPSRVASRWEVSQMGLWESHTSQLGAAPRLPIPLFSREGSGGPSSTAHGQGSSSSLWAGEGVRSSGVKPPHIVTLGCSGQQPLVAAEPQCSQRMLTSALGPH